ncbi:hypothetical protein Rin_00008720, partial [Candidatus Regiella insecticola 5.15]
GLDKALLAQRKNGLCKRHATSKTLHAGQVKSVSGRI